MNAFLLILKNDWLRLTRGRALKILAGLALLSGLYALIYGQTFVRRQQATIAELKLDEQTRLDSLATWARLDTSIAGNRTADRKAKWATATSTYEVNVPEGYRFAGHFDWAFVVIFLLPLLLIALSYNLLSSESELGTYALLRSQPVTLRQIVLAKLALRLLLVLGFLVGITLLSVPVLSINLAENGGLLTKFLLVSVVYGLFWGTVIFAVVSFQKTSAVNALTLLGCWLVLVLALPTLLQQILTVSQPIDRTTFENLVRDEYSQEQPDSVLMKPYYARRPDYFFATDTPKPPRESGPPDLRPYYARNEQLDLTLAPFWWRNTKPPLWPAKPLFRAGTGCCPPSTHWNYSTGWRVRRQRPTAIISGKFGIFTVAGMAFFYPKYLKVNCLPPPTIPGFRPGNSSPPRPISPSARAC